MTIMTNVNLTTICWVLSPLQHWLGWKSSPFVFKPFPKKWWVILKVWKDCSFYYSTAVEDTGSRRCMDGFWDAVLQQCAIYLLSLTWHDLKSVIAKHRPSTVQCFYVSVGTVDVPVIIAINSAGVWPTQLHQVCEWTQLGLHGNCNSQSSKHPTIHHPVCLRSRTWLVSTSHSENEGRTCAVATWLLTLNKWGLCCS